jgi:hypothetical protein
MTTIFKKSMRDAGVLLVAAGLLGMVLFGVSSCTTTTTPSVLPSLVVPEVVPNSQRHRVVHGIFCGLTKTSPNGANPCPGADIDAQFLAEDAMANGVRSTILLDADCNWRNIKYTVDMETRGLGAGDLLILTLSGHGTQFKDDNGDEADGMDEALCLFMSAVGPEVDYIRDDRIMTELLEPLWREHPGLDVFMITDTCHSEGNFRSIWRWITREPTSLSLVGKPLRGIDGALVQVAMCREDSYSYGDYSGGTGTQALLRARKGDIGRLAAFVEMERHMNTSIQQPVWIEFSNVSPLLRNGEFWR